MNENLNIFRIYYNNNIYYTSTRDYVIFVKRAERVYITIILFLYKIKIKRLSRLETFPIMTNKAWTNWIVWLFSVTFYPFIKFRCSSWNSQWKINLCVQISRPQSKYNYYKYLLIIIYCDPLVGTFPNNGQSPIDHRIFEMVLLKTVTSALRQLTARV